MSEKEVNDFKEIKKIQEVIEYQSNSIVSKALIDRKAGNITFFAFDKGQKLSEHTAPYDAFVYIIEGNAEVIISNKSYSLSSGEFIVMPANEPHGINANEPFKMMLVMIKD